MLGILSQRVETTRPHVFLSLLSMDEQPTTDAAKAATRGIACGPSVCVSVVSVWLGVGGGIALEFFLVSAKCPRRCLPLAVGAGDQRGEESTTMHVTAAMSLLLSSPILPHRSFTIQANEVDEPSDFEITLSKPLGIKLEENDLGVLVVKDLLPEGSAAASTFVWPGDELRACGDADISSCGFDAGMDAIIAAPAECILTFRRPAKTACIDFPDGERAFGVKGDSLRTLALRAGYKKIVYNCGEGSCGSCEMVLRSGTSERCRSVRTCKARLPSAELTPWELLTTDAEEAQEHFVRLKKLAEGRK